MQTSRILGGGQAHCDRTLESVHAKACSAIPQPSRCSTPHSHNSNNKASQKIPSGCPVASPSLQAASLCSGPRPCAVDLGFAFLPSRCLSFRRAHAGSRGAPTSLSPLSSFLFFAPSRTGILHQPPEPTELQDFRPRVLRPSSGLRRDTPKSFKGCPKQIDYRAGSARVSPGFASCAPQVFLQTVMGFAHMSIAGFAWVSPSVTMGNCTYSMLAFHQGTGPPNHQETNKRTNKQTNKQTDRQTDRQTDIQTDRQTDRQTNKQTNK